MNILFTSVGRRVELVRAFRSALTTLELEGRLIGIDIDPLAPALQDVDVARLVPPLTDASYLPTIESICREFQAALVIPLIDPDVSILAHHKPTLEKAGARLAVLGPDAAELVADKWTTYRFFVENEVPTPRTWLPEQLSSEEHRFPLFIKPREGSAGQKTYKVENERELEFYNEIVDAPIIQEFLDGPEVTSDVLCDLEGNLISVVSRERIEVRAGEVAKGKTIRNEEILQSCEKIAHALPATGPITVQCFIQNGAPLFTEINARFAGGVPLAIAAGADLPQWLIASVDGRGLAFPRLGDYTVGMHMTRYDDAYMLNETELPRVDDDRI